MTPKGRPKPAGSGRKKGTPNKVDHTLRGLLTQLSSDTFPTFVERLERIEDDKDYCNIWLKAQEFVLPKLAHQEVKIDAESSDTLSKLRELADKEID